MKALFFLKHAYIVHNFIVTGRADSSTPFIPPQLTAPSQIQNGIEYA